MCDLSLHRHRVELRPRGLDTTVIADLVLAPLAEGEYLIEVSTADAPEVARTIVAFRVVR